MPGAAEERDGAVETGRRVMDGSLDDGCEESAKVNGRVDAG